MRWRMAKSLDVLLAQLNALAPNRDKSSDGGIGNAEHSARTSDHNPDDDGVVKARDFTNDPAHGIVSEDIANLLLKGQDPRIKYLISNRKIGSGPAGPSPGVWRTYSGSNPHNHHFHISVMRDKAHYDDERPWSLDGVTITKTQNAMPIAGVQFPLLRKGAKGVDVMRLQDLLNRNGALLKADGDFGSATEAAVKIFQSSRNLVADGAVGKYTWEALKAKA